MRPYKVNRYKLVKYLMDNGATVEDVLSATSGNLTAQGFVFGDTTVPLTDELMGLIREHMKSNGKSISVYLFPSIDPQKMQSKENFVLAFGTYLKQFGEGKTLRDYNLVQSKPRKNAPTFDTIEDVLSFLKSKNIELPKETEEPEVVPEVTTPVRNHRRPVA